MTESKVDVGGRPAKYPWRECKEVGDFFYIYGDPKLAKQAMRKFCQRNPEFGFCLNRDVGLNPAYIERTK